MAYRAAYQDPGFAQSLPPGTWDFVGPCYFGALRYREAVTGAEAVVPALPYNQPPEARARALRFYAERARECAARKRAEGYAWSERDAAASDKQAADLDAKAAHLETLAPGRLAAPAPST